MLWLIFIATGYLVCAGVTAIVSYRQIRYEATWYIHKHEDLPMDLLTAFAMGVFWPFVLLVGWFDSL